MGNRNGLTERFWETKKMADMSRAEWEALCDGCARCCLLKLDFEDSPDIYYTNVACRLLDIRTCRCTRYRHRSLIVPDCLSLTPESAAVFSYLPRTCAYRCLAEGRPLPSWHPLISRDPDAIHRLGISIRDRAIPEEWIDPDQLENQIVEWEQGGIRNPDPT